MTTDFDTFAMSKHGAFIESMLGVRGHLAEADCIPPHDVRGKCCLEFSEVWWGVWQDSTWLKCFGSTADECRRWEQRGKEAGAPVSIAMWKPYEVCSAAGADISVSCAGSDAFACDQAEWRAKCAAEQGWCRIDSGPYASRTSRELCNELGGEYHDPIIVDAPIDWGPTLPCCVYTREGMYCFEWTAAECAAMGGVEHGAIGDTCDGLTCAFPNSWGACCYGDGTCEEYIYPQDCGAQPGTQWYACMTCDEISCEAGACCMPDGTCEDGLTSPACMAMDGLYEGPGTTCDDPEVDCEYRITVPCCLFGGGCWDVTAQVCEASDGMIMEGDNCNGVFNCPDDMGACCIDFDPKGNFLATCRMTTHHRCTNFGGRFFGAGERCSQTDCTEGEGACCRPSSGMCRDWPGMIRPICEETPGDIFVGTLGPGWPATCDTISCVGPIGACCVFGQRCQEVPIGACGPERGLWQGEGTRCDQVLCPDVLGACCQPDGGCHIDTEGGCEISGGTFQGVDVSCDEVDCGTTGRCCLPDGNCTMTGLMDCMAREGAWNGEPGEGCYSGVCNSGMGACCANQRCVSDRWYQPCVDAGGKFFGQGSDCAWARRDCTPGACCLPNGVCEYWTQAWCENRGGQWRGSYEDYFPKCRSDTGQSFDVDCSEPA